MQPSRGATLAITLGDPAGVGPEVALRAACALLRPTRRRVATRAPSDATRIVLIGDLTATREAVARLGLPVEILPRLPAEWALDVDRANATRKRLVLPLLAPDEQQAAALRPHERRPGKPSIAGARLAYAAIVRAVELARERTVDAI